MPIIDYNRIYGVRSQERRPVLNPVNVPDGAGAFLRAAGPASRAAMPGLRAQLGDVESRYREKAARDRDRFQAIGDLIGVGKDVARAYAGAVERRDEADLNALQAAWQAHMNEGADKAWRRTYHRGGENGEGADGPLVAIRQLDEDFDKSAAMNGARRTVKERFKQWRQRAAQRYYLKAQEKQTEAADLFQKNAFGAMLQAKKEELRKYYDIAPENTEFGLFESAVDELVQIATDKYAWEAERAGQPIQDGEIGRLKESIARAEIMNRVKYLCAVEAAQTTPAGPEDSAEIEYVKKIVENDKVFPSDEDRVAIKSYIETARQSRERNVAAALRIDNASADRLADKIGMGTATNEEAAEFGAIMNRLPDQDRAAREATRQHAAEFKEWQDWSNIYLATIPTGEGATLESTLGAIGTARREAAKLSPRAQSLAEKSLLPFRPVEDEYGKMCVGAIDVLCSLGVWNGQDVDLRKTRDILTDALEGGIIDARKFDSLFSAAQRSAEARASRASAMPGPGTGEEFQRVMRRYLPDRVVDRFTQIDLKSHALSFTDRFDESGSYDTPEKWSDRSNAVLATMVNAMTRFHALQASGRLKPEQTLDSFVAEVMTNDENYRRMTDEAVIKAFDDRIGELENAADMEDARRLNPYFRTSYDAPRFDLMPGKQK